MRTIIGLVLIIALFAGCLGAGGVDTQAATYVGSERCGECHKDKYEDWKNTFHSRMMQDPKENPNAILGDFESENKFRTFTKEDVAYTIAGNMAPAQHYLTSIDGDLFYLPASWNGVAWAPRNPMFWNKPENSWFITCSGCHSTGPKPEEKTMAEAAIGCEACHGPGSIHAGMSTALAARAGAIVNPAKLSGHLEVQVCSQCHTNGKDPSGTYSYPIGYVPGMNLEHYYNPYTPGETPEQYYPDGTSKAHHPQYLDWVNGAHGAAGIICTDCHDPHKRDNHYQLKEEGNNLCFECHEMTGTPTLTHSIHDFGDCIGCHMAELGHGGSHNFKVVTPEETVTLAGGNLTIQPNSCNACHYHADDTPEELADIMEAIRDKARGKTESAAVEEEAAE
ncbi:ammonia-forming cytochrome c nitrite reductase subunit c552 [archaeon]|nr:ammonia-forming cytochrome c nitrite reductase subunit c552 [archaeon]